MAEHIYKASMESDEKKVKNAENWRLEDIYTYGLSLKMGLYSKTDKKGIKEYALVNKGTTWYNPLNWDNNVVQPFGISPDMWQSIFTAREFVENNSCSEVTMIGHSKGGAEAAANAIATNTNSILFNPATVFLGSYKLSADDYTKEMTVYIVKGEMLNFVEGWFSEPIDKMITLTSQNKYAWWNGLGQLWKPTEDHSMPSVIESLINEGY
jgi:hypothetical protein